MLRWRETYGITDVCRFGEVYILNKKKLKFHPWLFGAGLCEQASTHHVDLLLVQTKTASQDSVVSYSQKDTMWTLDETVTHSY